jgi:hypothetical protein
VLCGALPANGLNSALHGEALHGIRNPHSIVLRAAESRRGRLSVDDTLALATRGSARHLGRLALLIRRKGDAQREGDIDAAARGCYWCCGCAGPTGRLSLHRLLLVAPSYLKVTEQIKALHTNRNFRSKRQYFQISGN